MLIKSFKIFEEYLVGNNPIENIDKYIDGMGKSIDDKIFFIDMIPECDCIVDFGCADGSVIKYLSSKTNIPMVGYDIDPDMIQLAKSKNIDHIFLDKWDEIINEISKYKFPLLNLGSVIHEVYSYSNSRTIKSFWENIVFGGLFKFISIRDMIPSTSMSKINRKSFEKDVKSVKSKSNKKYLESFEKRWGIIDDDYRTFVHYLLKYRFIENWEREVNENYLPISLETLKKKIPINYSIKYENNFVLPFLRNKVKEDFEIDLNEPTHTKMLIVRN